jgi:hypothetical protein
MRNLVLALTFFLLTPLAIGISGFSLLTLSEGTKTPPEVLAAADFSKTENFGVQVYASLPASVAEIGGSAEISDARPEIVRQYLASYDSPLMPYADQLVATADYYGLDFRLTTAIAQQESNLCKKIPAQSFNCWGWGIHSKGTLKFTSFVEGIEIVSRGLKEEYVDKGYVTIEDIMGKYTPLSKGSWAEGVIAFMQEME